LTNLSTAESRIRDADLASEAANLTKAQILMQAGVAALDKGQLGSAGSAIAAEGLTAGACELRKKRKQFAAAQDSNLLPDKESEN